jgi:methyl-accepting chemotaxis protein
MATRKRAAAKKSSRTSSKQSTTAGESIPVAELLEALQRVNEGKPIRAPRDAKPEVARVFQELKTLALRAGSSENGQAHADHRGNGSSLPKNGAVPSLDEANERLRDLAERVHDASEALANAHSYVTDLPSGEQATANGNEMVRRLDEALEQCDRGEDAALRTISEIYRTKESMHLAVSVISTLGFRLEWLTGQCEALQALILELNLLMVNGQILAAQAGKHGVGFRAVIDRVAECRIAMDSNVREIQEMISTIRSESNGGISAIENHAHSVDPGVEKANEAQRAFGHLRNACTEMRPLTQAALQSIASWKQATDCLHLAKTTVAAITTETDALTVWGANLQATGIDTRIQLLDKAIAQWNSAGGQLLSFAQRMEQSTAAQEQTFRRLGDLLNKIERK